MPSRSYLPILVLSVWGFSTPPTDKTWKTIRADGIGPANISMSLAQLNAALDEKFVAPMDKDERECFFVDSTQHPGVSFMIEEGKLTRVDLDNRSIESAKGIRVGDTEAHAIAAYGGQLRVEPNAYTGPADHVLTYSSPDGKYGLKFILDQGKIRVIYAGLSSSISYIEGCE
jgi:hypothetical protein